MVVDRRGAVRLPAGVALARMAVIFLVLWGGGAANAFGTVNFAGQHSEHQRITRWALADAGLGRATLDSLAGVDGGFGAVGAPDKPWRGLFNLKAAHCDGGDFFDALNYPKSRADARARLVACRAWTFEYLHKGVVEAGALAGAATDGATLGCRFNGKPGRSAKCRVLEDLGIALHASQDFYAHTNWVDRTAPEAISPLNPPGLGNDGPADWINPRLDAPFPEGLISGCYDGFPEALHCGHGGANPRIAHAVLNKDTGVIDVANREVGVGTTRRGRVGGNFQRAVEAAVADTRDKWRYFEQSIVNQYGAGQGRVILCRLKSDQPVACGA